MGQQLRHGMFRAGLAALHHSGAARALAPRLRGLGAILMFHHVRPWVERAFAPNRLLEITPGYLDAVLGHVRQLGYTIVPLDEVPGRLASPRPGQPFVALTFDDGYRNNVEHALPVLRRHGAPFTLFVTTGFADGSAPLWWDDLERAVAVLDHVRLPDGRLLPARSLPQKHAAYAAFMRQLRVGAGETLPAAVAVLAGEAGIDSLARTRELCLGWDELRALGAEPLANFGAHTLTHPMLATLQQPAMQAELAQARQRLAAELGRAVPALAYPVGDAGAAGPREFAAAAALGHSVAVTTRPGVLHPEHAAHLLALPRLSVNGLHQSLPAFETLLSGVPFWLFNRGRRLNVA
jgi:peptidoglycan/xylan/chitin deacetylase (PgdA/CDA1 family)